MAPRFLKNIYWSTYEENKADFLIGFTIKDERIVRDFRDGLVSHLCAGTQYFVDKQEGCPTRWDSTYRIFDTKNLNEVNLLRRKKVPGFWDSLLKNKSYKDWQEEYNKIIHLSAVELETSHDFPCLIVNNKVFNLEHMKNLLQQVGKELNIELSYNGSVENFNSIIMSNDKFPK